ncbi:ABC transporter ATP-binding protein [Leptolinea tardivitalis]|uniref:Sugar ABC transporter ATP-binding protein n=1 Tax=Leptolinea tardivitalis TaxID=229920 RepID=A0A0P6XZZ4_9CHLR|nr:ATP-binding cassette domain-containing protein [Leptolinea tardivitalis]KPL74764.1 sugar ABC transporter ATP-binding protein [Leptolinea tardivitalis]GAP22863.1 nucleoside ABC transporter ATP-binding protein [Leptolinea tardivitalis]
MKVELRSIHKYFGPVHANNNISLTILPGTIQGIVGENGAGKSTLMKILSGFIQADEGEILLDDQVITIHSPSDALKRGIGMLHQDPLDFPPMKVIDNLLIGQEGGLFPNKRKVAADIKKLANQFGFSIDTEAYVEGLTVGERQQLEIIRLLWMGARILILDEPTTGISASQKEKLFETLTRLASEGMIVIFVSHKLEEIETLCHRAAVFRGGLLVGEAIQPYHTDDLVRLMFGKPMELGSRLGCHSEENVVEIHNLEIEDPRLHIRDVDLDVKAGEVIGLAGMEGSGQRLFLRALGGLLATTGRTKLLVKGHDLTHEPYSSYLKTGVAYVPADRMEEGLIPGLTLKEHFILTGDTKKLFIDQEESLHRTKVKISEFNIKGRPDSYVEELSGGNQQRALLALLNEPLSLVLLEHPSRGLDLESTIWLWEKLKERCKTGTAVIFISSDLEQILHYSDRILVFFGGKVSKPMLAAETNVDQLGQLIGGKGFVN